MLSMFVELEGAHETGYVTKEYVEAQIARVLSVAQTGSGGLPAGGNVGDFLRMTVGGPAWQALPAAEGEGF